MVLLFGRLCVSLLRQQRVLTGNANIWDGFDTVSNELLRCSIVDRPLVSSCPFFSLMLRLLVIAHVF